MSGIAMVLFCNYIGSTKGVHGVKENDEKGAAGIAGETPKGAKRKDRRGKRVREPAAPDVEDTDDKDTRRIKLIQVKVASNLKRRAVRRAKMLDMGLSEYIRFLLYCDIHGFTPKGNE